MTKKAGTTSDATLTGATPIEGGASPDVMRAPEGALGFAAIRLFRIVPRLMVRQSYSTAVVFRSATTIRLAALGEYCPVSPAQQSPETAPTTSVH
jgi:hypothetical protein